MKVQLPSDHCHRKYCECDDPSCFLVIDIDDEQYKKLHRAGRIIISAKCGTGVRPVAVSYIGAEAGYTVYELVKE